MTVAGRSRLSAFLSSKPSPSPFPVDQSPLGPPSPSSAAPQPHLTLRPSFLRRQLDEAISPAIEPYFWDAASLPSTSILCTGLIDGSMTGDLGTCDGSAEDGTITSPSRRTITDPPTPLYLPLNSSTSSASLKPFSGSSAASILTSPEHSISPLSPPLSSSVEPAVALPRNPTIRHIDDHSLFDVVKLTVEKIPIKIRGRERARFSLFGMLTPTSTPQSPQLFVQSPETESPPPPPRPQPLIEETTIPNMTNKLYYALVELVDSEGVYLDSLRTLVNVNFASLPSLQLTSQEIVTIVRNSQAVLELHERVVSRLAWVEENLGWRSSASEGVAGQGTKLEKVAARIARTILDELPSFEAYRHFCARHSEASDLIRTLEYRPTWNAYQQECFTRLNSLGLTTVTITSTVLTTPSTPVVDQANPLNPFFANFSTPPRPPAPPVATKSQNSRLQLQDYAIQPIQQICRYPLLLGAVWKNMEASAAKSLVGKALEGLKAMARSVDEARRVREAELRTKLVASRMELMSTVNSAFCDLLGGTLLVGTLHVLHRFPTPRPQEAKYFGCFLYRSHIVMVKVKKREVYEPREWLPLRLFTLFDVPQSEEVLPHGVRLSHGEHHFDLGATCAAEKQVWLTKISLAKNTAHKEWELQPLDSEGLPTLFDETLVSSIMLSDSSPPGPPGSFELPHPHRSNSTTSAAGRSSSGTPSLSHTDSDSTLEHSSPSTPSDCEPPSPNLREASSTLLRRPSSYKSDRLTVTASVIVGRTPSTHRAAIDAKFEDVMSEECLAARALACSAEGRGNLRVASEDGAGLRGKLYAARGKKSSAGAVMSGPISPVKSPSWSSSPGLQRKSTWRRAKDNFHLVTSL